jgi:transposase
MDITNEQWQRIAKFIPKPKAQPGKSGRPPQNPRDVLNGILWILRTGAQWTDLPQWYPPKSTCHRYFQQWNKSGVFAKILTALARDLKERGIEMIAPHKYNRCQASTQDGRALRRYRKRWKIERLFTWLQNFRRLVVRYEYHLENFLAMIRLGCIVILLRRVLG